MTKSIFALLATVVTVFLSGCATTNGAAFNDYPPIASGQGQLVIFSAVRADSKLRFTGEVECNGTLCSRVIDVWGGKGVYSVHSLTPREVVIKAPGKKFVPFAGNVELDSNALTVHIESGKRTVVMVTLMEGRELVGNGQVGNAKQLYRIDRISEDEALPKLKGLTEVKLREPLK